MAERFVTMEHTLKVLLEERKYSTLKDVLVTMNGADVAAVIAASSGTPKETARRSPSRRWMQLPASVSLPLSVALPSFSVMGCPPSV